MQFGLFVAARPAQLWRRGGRLHAPGDGSGGRLSRNSWLRLGLWLRLGEWGLRRSRRDLIPVVLIRRFCIRFGGALRVRLGLRLRLRAVRARAGRRALHRRLIVSGQRPTRVAAAHSRAVGVNEARAAAAHAHLLPIARTHVRVVHILVAVGAGACSVQP